jgi:4-diphosphocytidyl-2-C-methyl-D-erythritol kinase
VGYTTAAPAKINWTLEILGRRDDGYHEVRTILQTIDLADHVTVRPGPGISLQVGGPAPVDAPLEENLAYRAAALLREEAGVREGAEIELWKRVPAAAGLGGGSSDAAAVLRALSALWGLDLPAEHLAALGAKLGSDVPFFCHGGTALGAGRGDQVQPLPDIPEQWLVLALPPLTVAGKTGLMYSLVTAGLYTDGSTTDRLRGEIERGRGVRDDDIINAFQALAADVFDGLEPYVEAVRKVSAAEPHLAGSGPTLFTLAPDAAAARAYADRLREAGVEAVPVRTLAAAEATRLGSED